ncbi:hypothetical protein G6F31_018285 [Rhizopus arrhizus]|nr:hypothetical protein G6F31_018285 [Rhizopus arrhizus]
MAPRRATPAAARLVRASATAMRPEAGASSMAMGRHGAIRHRHLPGADHLVAGNQAGDGAVANGDQEALAGHGRVVQHALDGVVQVQLARVEVIAQLGFAGNRTVHARRLAQDHVDRHVHGAPFGLALRADGVHARQALAVHHAQLARFGGHAHDRVRAAIDRT